MIQEQSILKTIEYSKIFDYPLTVIELHSFLPEKISINDLQLKLNQMHKDKLIYLNKNYVLDSVNSIHLIDIRHNRQIVSKYHWRVIKEITGELSQIPFIYSITITGSLAVNNSEKNSDIDFFVLTKRNRVWLVRLLLFFLELNLEKRKYLGIDFCFNYIIDDSGAELQPGYIIGRELVQMKPLFKSRFNNFIFKKNQWIQNYFPNMILSQRTQLIEDTLATKKRSYFSKIIESMDHNIGKLIFNILNEFEMKRAYSKIFRNYKLTSETYFSKNIYKGHFASNYKKMKNKLKFDSY
jgi:predicted nucleotidyltransferase